MDPITLQELLDELAREGGNLAEFLAAGVTAGRFSVAQADALLAEAAEAANAIVNAEARTTADVAALTSLRDVVSAVRETRTGIVEAEEAQAAEIAALAAEIVPTTAGTTDEPGDESADGEEGSESADDGGELTVDVPDDASAITDQEPVLTASTPVAPVRRQRVDVAAIARRTQRPDPSTAPGSSDVPFGGALVASAGAPGARPGSAYDSWSGLGEVAMRSFGSTSPRSLDSLVAAAAQNGQTFRQRNGLAEFRMDFPEDLTIYDDQADASEILARAADQSRLPGGSLVAAGGWCSPSETMYDLCDLPCSLDGILSLPEVSAPRGGLRWTKGLEFAAIYNGTGYFHFTEAEMMATPRPDKPCMEIPCPSFQETRLDVDGLCITGDIMQNRTYPEVVAQFLQGAMCAHAHRVNAFKIAAISALTANQGSVTQAGYGAVANVLYAIELQIQAYRYRGRRAQEGTPALLELVAPYWIKGVLRADIANRNAPSGVGNPLMVSDADIVAWFASRGVAVQYVYDWQDLETVEADVLADPTPLLDYPNTVEFLLYEAGTYVVPSLDVITLETIYDSTLIKQNKYQALFTEQAFSVIERCGNGLRFQVPICATGNTGAQVAVVCA